MPRSFESYAHTATRFGSARILTPSGQDSRRRALSRALAVLREKGAVRELGTHDEARAALVRTWTETTRAGKSALLVASRNDDVRVMNQLAREAMRERLGDERKYATDFGGGLSRWATCSLAASVRMAG